jgi:uncharacterized protein
MSDIEVPLESPCVDNCCLDDDEICLGCFRSLDEIKQWNGATNPQRLAVLRNCSRRRQEKSSRKTGQA